MFLQLFCKKVINIISRNKLKKRYIISIINKVHIDMLITVEYLRLIEILTKMVAANQITESDKSELLHKSGLIKQEDKSWKEPSGAIITF